MEEDSFGVYKTAIQHKTGRRITEGEKASLNHTKCTSVSETMIKRGELT
jgi:hypothetical protein